MASRTELKPMTRVMSLLLLSLLVAGCAQDNSRDIGVAAFEHETGASWPLIVDTGKLVCDPETKSVYFYDPETTNSYIIGEERLHVFTKQITLIRKPGTDIDPLKQFGLALC